MVELDEQRGNFLNLNVKFGWRELDEQMRKEGICHLHRRPLGRGDEGVAF